MAPKVLPYKEEHKEQAREFTGMCPTINKNEELIFDSNFESGNLDMVLKTGPFEYDLMMRVDTNTPGHH